MLTRMLHILIRHRAATLAVTGGVLVVMAFLARDARIDNSLESWFVEGDPALASYRSFVDDFGSDEVVVIGVHGPSDALGAERQRRLAHTTAAIEKIEGVARVHSLANVPRTGEDGLASRLIGRDGKTLVILAWMSASDDVDRQRPRVLEAIRDAVAGELAPTESASYGGVGVLHTALNEATIGEGTRFIVLSWLVIAVALLLITRRWLWTALALGVVTVADVLLIGTLSALGRPVNMITVALPPLVMILGVANVVHMSTDIEISLSRGRRSPRELVSALAEIARPCLFNTITTAVALLSLTTASMAVTRDYGIFAAVGVVLAFALSLVAMTLVLPHAARLRPAAGSRNRLADTIEAVVVRGMRHRGSAMVVALIVAAVAVAGAARIEVDTYSIGFLPADDPAREDDIRLERTVGPYLPLELTLRTRGASWMDPQFLKAVASAQQRLETDATLGRTTSVVDVLRDMHVAVTGHPSPRPWTPTTTQEVESSLALLERAGHSHVTDALVGADDRTLRLTASTPSMSARQFVRTAERARHLAQKATGPGVEVSLSGYLPLYSSLIQRVVADQVTSFALAFLLVFVVIALVLRSGRLALLAIPPNLLPVAIVLGVMGYSGIRLDVATVTVAAVVLGVIVDDTVHLLHRLRRELGAGADLESAMRRIARASGLAVVSTSLVFTAGFLVISQAASDAVGHCGLLIAVATASALVTDLVLLPAFVAWFLPRTALSPVRRGVSHGY